MGTYIDVVDTAILCGLDIKESTLNGRNVQARCPYCNDYKYRMYLCRDPDNPTWWCHNCSTGGNAITLFADFNPMGESLSTRDAYHILLNRPDITKGVLPYDYEPLPPRIKPLRERSGIYLAFLQMLSLEPRHRQNLLSRGLTDEIIDANMYRSIPTGDSTKREIAKELSARYDLADMPGFFTKDFQWNIAGKHSGFFTPVCDHNNYIQGLQMRLDSPPPIRVVQKDGNIKYKKGDRFRWLSTAGKYYENGTPINSYIHVVGDLSSDVLHLTEGVIKADVASFLSGGHLFAGLTGVGNTRFLEQVIKELRPRKIVECIDMDCRVNPHVQKAQARIQSICIPLCEEYEVFFWPKEYNGIDDYLFHQTVPQLYQVA